MKIFKYCTHWTQSYTIEFPFKNLQGIQELGKIEIVRNRKTNESWDNVKIHWEKCYAQPVQNTFEFINGLLIATQLANSLVTDTLPSISFEDRTIKKA
jgi:hypothetical protein